LHGLALIIQRLWEKLGFKLWTWFAWFITFNFVNIAWVFFRAKEWEDAVKVLGAMFSLDNVVLPERLSSKLSFLSNYGIEFGVWAKDISGNDWTAIWLISGFIMILFFKNSIQKIEKFKTNTITAFYISFALYYSFISMISKKSEFLYFNF
jgi:alginate O-acetyltransferase complex protein AlgI